MIYISISVRHIKFFASNNAVFVHSKRKSTLIITPKNDPSPLFLWSVNIVEGILYCRFVRMCISDSIVYNYVSVND